VKIAQANAIFSTLRNMRKLYLLAPKIFYSLPIQLLIVHVKRNQVLLLIWILLLAMITGNFGKYLGIPYLFLDPEYLNKVNFTSFFILGVMLASLTTAFHITCYINDGHRFSFIGALEKPFSKFSLNNSILPLTFMGIYVYQLTVFQINNEFLTSIEVLFNLAGLFTGYLAFTFVLYLYFILTQKDIFKYMVCKLDERLKQNVRVTRASVLRKLDIARKKQVRVDYYLNFRLRPKPVAEIKDFYDKASIIQVFDQNHFNLVIIELLLFALVIVLGLFKDHPAFQLPAAATFLILLTMITMLSGAFTYWFGSWSGTMSVALFLVVNHLYGEEFFSKPYKAFGLDYQERPAPYTVAAFQKHTDSLAIQEDYQVGLTQLHNWRHKFDYKPKMIFLCVSGGGKRASLWTITCLQVADSLTKGALMNQSVLITGASGGLIGASYFRELYLRKQQQEQVQPYAQKHLNQIATDNLNPLIFSLLANDLFNGISKFEYAGIAYDKDRAYTFERELSRITGGLMDKPIQAYAEVEISGQIPMIILSPTVVNDGRKMFIASRPIAFMNSEIQSLHHYPGFKYGGIDFMRLLKDQGSHNLRFLSALRMSATFPYITPNTTLPTQPPIQIMDAGITDNFGLSDAIRFIYPFRDFINNQTSGIVLVSIRDSPKVRDIAPRSQLTIVDELTQPISSVYNNFENIQDITSDLLIGQATQWLDVPIARIDLEYQAESYVPILQKMDSIRQNSARASLSWRLTTREKRGIIANVKSERNQEELKKLVQLITAQPN
jgi:hypothetical protein